MKNQEKKEWAKLLFVKESLNQKVIALKVGVTEKTISSWANKDNWLKLRQSISVTKAEQLSMLYTQLGELNQKIMSRPEGERFANTKEADVRKKTISDIKDLETEAGIADIIEVSIRFLDWMRPINFEKAREIADLFDVFIKENLKK